MIPLCHRGPREYVNREVKKLLSKEGINHIYTFYETKADYAERVIKTIKLKIAKYWSSKETFKWVDELQNITFSYNNSKHRSIKMSPMEAKNLTVILYSLINMKMMRVPIHLNPIL